MIDIIDRKTKKQASKAASSDRKFDAYSHEGTCHFSIDSDGAGTWSC